MKDPLHAMLGGTSHHNIQERPGSNLGESLICLYGQH